MTAPLRMFIPLTKVDAETRTVYGLATGETVDRSGEICDYATTKPFYEAWSGDISKASGGKNLGNVRAMHGKVAAGKVTAITFNDASKQIEIAAKIVDDAEWAKVQEGVYTGFSQGGAYEKRWTDDAGLKRYTAAPSEVSLVDLPCLPTATFQMIKAAGAVEDRHFKPVVDVPQIGNGAVMEKAAELAKAAGRADDVPAFFDAARDALVKAVLPAPEPLPAAELHEVGLKPEAPLAPGDGLEQVWKARDGATFAKKADAVAHNAELDAAAAVAPSTKAALDVIGDINEKLGIGKAREPDPKPPAAAAPIPVPAKAVTADDLSKNLFRVSRLAELLATLKSMQESTEVDALYGFATQDPEVATQMKAWIAQGCSLLIVMVEHESASLVGDVDDDMLMAAGAKLLAGDTAAIVKASGVAPHLAKLLPTLQKAGARHSKADKDRVQAMHDGAVELGAACGDASKAHAPGDLQKALDVVTADRDLNKAHRDALQKTLDEQILPMLKTIGAEVAIIKAQPLPLPLQGGAARVVSKGDDHADGGDLAGQLAKLKADDPDRYAMLMIKAAQSDPRQMSIGR